MRDLFRPLWALLLALGLSALAPAQAQDQAELIRSMVASGALVTEVPASDARLAGRSLTTILNADGRAEVLVATGGEAVRTPLKTPTERMTVEEYRALTSDIREAVRRVTGIEVERVIIAGSSTGIPFTDPRGEVRSFDRKGPLTSDYDGALVSKELYEYIAERNPRSLRGKTTGARTAPDPLPELTRAFDAISQKYGRHVAAMVYDGPAEFQKRMELLNFEVGRNVMPEPPASAERVLLTQAEVIGALVEVQALESLKARLGTEEARRLVERAAEGETSAREALSRARAEAVRNVQARSGSWSEVDQATLRNELARLEARGSGFGPERARSGPLEPVRMDLAELRGTFAEVAEAARARGVERLAELPEAERAAARASLARLGSASLEVVHTNDVVARYEPGRNVVELSVGFLNELALSPELRGRAGNALRLVLGHELAHAGGITVERVADAEALRIAERSGARITEADIRGAVRTFSAEGSGASGLLSRLGELTRYGTESGRIRALERSLAGQPDALLRYRRADGTVRWSEVARDGALRHGAGAAHFALALFLKELAVVVQTGDGLRIEEFFDHLATTDFFVTYGLFSAGAQAGSVAYSRYLQSYIKPGFVSGVLRTNVTLATGMALADIVQGHFDGKVFAINLVSLGLSTTAVQAGLQAIRWVTPLERLRGAELTRRLAGMRRLARFGGWFYTAAETAVVLYLGDEISQAITRHLDERAARAAVAEGGAGYLEALGAGLSDAELAAALDELGQVHADYRNSLYRDVVAADSLYGERLERASKDAKRLADREAALRERLDQYPALRAALLRQHDGDLEAAIRSQLGDDGRELEAFVTETLRIYERSRAAAIEDVYTAPRRSGAYAGDDRLLRLAGRGEDPYGDRNDLFARWGRQRLRGDLLDELRDISGNRLQAYDDHIALLRRSRELVSASQRALIDARIAQLRETQSQDAALFQVEGVRSDGATGALGREVGGR